MKTPTSLVRTFLLAVGFGRAGIGTVRMSLWLLLLSRLGLRGALPLSTLRLLPGLQRLRRVLLRWPSRDSIPSRGLPRARGLPQSPGLPPARGTLLHARALFTTQGIHRCG